MRKTVAEIYCAGAKEETGVSFTVTELDKHTIAIDAQGEGAHAASPQGGNNAITAMLHLVSTMHLPDCPQVQALHGLHELIPHGDYLGEGLGVKMSDEISGELTLSLDIIHVTPTGLEAQFDCRSPLCANDQNMKYAAMQAEACAECWNTDDAELVVVAFGSMARIARSAIRKLREEGLKAGLFRPKTLYPFPADALRALAPGRRFLVIEQNTGQMVEDVRLSLMGENARVDWHGVMPGLFIGADALEDPIRQACKEN